MSLVDLKVYFEPDKMTVEHIRFKMTYRSSHNVQYKEKQKPKYTDSCICGKFIGSTLQCVHSSSH